MSVTLLADTPVLQIATNSDDSAWLLSKHRLVKRSRDGTLQTTVDLTTVGINAAGLLALDPFDGSVWLVDGSGKGVVHLNAQGQSIGKWDAPGIVRALALGLDETVWLLGNKQLWHFASSGTQLAAIDLHMYTQVEPKLLVADSIGQKADIFDA